MPRIRDFGVIPGYLSPGPLNAITDVPGVRVGHTTIWRDVDGVPWRTGVTAIWPHAGNVLRDNVYGAIFPLNGIGEVTARSVIDEWGLLGFPIMLTGTNHVGIVYHWTLQYLFEHGAKELDMTSLIAMVAECDDSYLDGSRGRAVSQADVYAALASASGGYVPEGCVGAGTGMQLFGLKGGIGTASRQVQVGEAQYTVGVLVLTNYGALHELRVDGIEVGRVLMKEAPQVANEGSCIVVVATDAPLSPGQCARLAKRAALGLARTGSTARDMSGEIMIAFATGNLIAGRSKPEMSVRTLVEGPAADGLSYFNVLFTGAVEATEEAVYNALVAAETTSGVDAHVLEAISHDRLRTILQRS
jgi:D-aminopeptidase